jgi:hypothetical protein
MRSLTWDSVELPLAGDEGASAAALLAASAVELPKGETCGWRSAEQLKIR